MFSQETYIDRRNKLRKKFKSGLLLFLGNTEAPMNYPGNTYKYRQDSNFLYFFGIDHPGLAAVMDIEAGTDCIYGDDYTMDDIIWMGPQPTITDMAKPVGVHSVHPLKDLANTINIALKHGRRIHFLPPYRSNNILQLSNLMGIHPNFIKNYTSVNFIKAVVSLRSIKDELEIAEIEKACNIGYLMHVASMKMAKPGIYEREIAGHIEGIALGHGSMVSFPIILSQNGETLHNHYHGNKLVEGRMMVTDAGAETEMHYASDFTRTVPVGGKFSTKQKEIYDIVLAANNRTIEIAKPGVTYQSVHLEAARVIAQGLKELGIMKGNVEEAVRNGAHALFMPHGLGHMMGLDVHDMEDLGENYVGYDDEVSRIDQFGTAYLRLGRRLEPGFVLTDEPGIYFIPALIDQWKSEKINASFINYDKVEEYRSFGGIRIEDDLLITDKGARLLGKKRIPVTTEEIEETMRG